MRQAFFCNRTDFSQPLFLPRPGPRNWEQRFRYVKSSTRDKIKGAAHQVKGAVKEKAGKALGRPNLQDRGAAEKVGGTIRQKVGDVKKVFGK